MVVVAQPGRRHAQRRAPRAAGLQLEERIGAVPALPDQLPARDLVAPLLHQPGAGDLRAAVREADAQAALRVRHLVEPPAEETPPLRRAVSRVPVAGGQLQPRARRDAAAGYIHAHAAALAV